MDEILKKRLEYLKEKQKQEQNKRLMMEEKTRLISNIDDFEQNYRFANGKETYEINLFISALPAISPTRLDFEKLVVKEQVENIYLLRQYAGQNVWICCICGSKELINIYTYGKLDDFINEFSDWINVSAYLLIIFSNMREFIFIDDDENIIKSSIL
ncbi:MULTISPECIES: hypothetical protein [unclassified Clostridium]|uniref:hypothetical protein n=1 Tax=unclassified Clostridium TaxID=2614128 RepID=UPI000297E3EB|nr:MULTISPECIES: hypothetical protein [unclassified Clostridium]EKQ57609.1 MAG: hypothetical protein A370_00741 [Clostridium sp. Maddingley MBC34-26]